jgi:hypothetical protein
MQLLKLEAKDGAAYDYFGVSVAVSFDGARVVVGANGHESYSGSAYVFDGDTGAQLLKLAAEDGAAGDEFGRSVAMSSDGARVVVGAYWDDDLGHASGSAYIFDGANGAQLLKLAAEDGAAGDRLGYSVAVSSDGSRAAVGVFRDDDLGPDSGSAFVFEGPTPATNSATSSTTMTENTSTTETAETSTTTVTTITATTTISTMATATIVTVFACIVMTCVACGAVCALAFLIRRRRRCPTLCISTVHNESDGGWPKSMDLWFIPVDEIMRVPADRPLPQHQVWRDSGLLVLRKMNFDDVLSGQLAVDTAAVSHSWPDAQYFDPDGAKLRKLQVVLKGNPSIKFLWIDWVCAPQLHGVSGSDDKEFEFRWISDNTLPFIFLGCQVIVLYDRFYKQQFWSNVECWIASKMPTDDGLQPASDDHDHFRIQVHSMHPDKEDQRDLSSMLDMWRAAGVLEAIKCLSRDEFLDATPKEKEIFLNVVASLDEQVRRIFPAGHLRRTTATHRDTDTIFTSEISLSFEGADSALPNFNPWEIPSPCHRSWA